MSYSFSAETSEATATRKSNKKQDDFPDSDGGSPGFFSHGNIVSHM
jgi:hypothetical protein